MLGCGFALWGFAFLLFEFPKLFLESLCILFELSSLLLCGLERGGGQPDYGPLLVEAHGSPEVVVLHDESRRERCFFGGILAVLALLLVLGLRVGAVKQ